MAKATKSEEGTTKEPSLTAEQELRATKEALRLQELDAAEREERIATLEAQQAKAAKATAKVTNLPTVEHDGKQYRFVYHALKFNGVKMTAAEIAEDEELVAQLVTNGSAAIEAV